MDPQLLEKRAETPTPADGEAGTSTVDAPAGLNLRAKPNTGARVIRQIDDGTTVAGTGATATDDDDRVWVEIRDGDDTGWVAEEFLRPA